MKAKQEKLAALFRQATVIPVLTIERLEDAVPLARALVAGGVRVLEVTLRTPVAIEAAKAIMAEVPEAIVGIGTILNADDLARAEDIGAQFGISPGTTPELLKAAAASGLPFAPGIATASELMQALAHGFGLVKFFPAEQSGGIKALRALAGPFPGYAVLPDRRHRRGQRGGVAGRAQRGRGRRFLAVSGGRYQVRQLGRHNRHVPAGHEIAETGPKIGYITTRARTGRTTMTASIVGWAHTPFGKFDAETVESLVVKVAADALADAGISAGDVDEIVLGHFNAGFSPQDFTASLVLQADPALRFKPATRVENACATGSAAVHQGIRAIAAGDAKIVLVVGVEQMTRTPPAEIGRNLLRASYLPEDGDTPGGFAGVFGKIAQAYFQKYGDQSDALAMIAAKNHKNGVSNPYAQMRKDFGYEFCRSESEKNPFVAGPLKRTDCSLVSDGAAALVLTDAETAKTMGKAVNIRATAHAQDFLPMSKRDILQFEGCTVAWQRALASAGVQLSDLSFVETHDCFTVAELIEYEAMGLTPRGQGARAIKEGWTQKDGKLPVNPSGGLKAKGHPIGATGVSMHVLSAMQLLDQAPEGMQIKNAKLAGIFNMGGAAVANYVSVLEPAK